MRKRLGSENEQTPKDIGSELKNRLQQGLGIENLDFSLADLRNSEIPNADCRRGLLRHARFAGSKFNGGRFDRSDLRDANFQRSHLNSASFQSAQMDNIRLESAVAMHANFQEAILKRGKLSMARLQHSSLDNAVLMNANLTGTDFRWTSLCGVNLSGSNWIDAHLFKCRFNQETIDKSGMTEKDKAEWLRQGAEFISYSKVVSPGLWVQLQEPLPKDVLWWMTAAAQTVGISIDTTEVPGGFIHIESNRCLMNLGKLLGSISAGHENPNKNQLKYRMHPQQWILFSDAFTQNARISLWTQGLDGVKKIEDWTHYDAEVEET